jgi:hypothetical protein
MAMVAVSGVTVSDTEHVTELLIDDIIHIKIRDK